VAETSESDFVFRQIKPGDRLVGLSLGDAKFTPLKTYLQRNAAVHHNANLAKTYGSFTSSHPSRLVGYITLVCGQIELQRELADLGQEVEYGYDHYPAIKIARLAVDRRYKGRGIGQTLVKLALAIVRNEVCPHVGCRFVVVDAKPESVSFYEEKVGFTALATHENRASDRPVMFVDIHRAARAMSS
jgi:ribosomal protein S18 acetylase RimI-like enzyme